LEGDEKMSEKMSPFKALSHLTYRAVMDNDTTVEQCLEWYNIVADELKALDIIKKKRVNLEYLKCCKTYDQYKTVCSYWNEITQEEYDLLKEVLL
jgi:hypothetical protein